MKVKLGSLKKEARDFFFKNYGFSTINILKEIALRIIIYFSKSFSNNSFSL